MEDNNLDQSINRGLTIDDVIRIRKDYEEIQEGVKKRKFDEMIKAFKDFFMKMRLPKDIIPREGIPKDMIPGEGMLAYIIRTSDTRKPYRSNDK